MKIAIGADHAGFPLKQQIAENLRKEGHEVSDLGTNSTESCDYPDFAAAVGRDVAAGVAERGIVVCTTGTGMVIAANKINGVRAALAVNEDEVELSRHHNDANVLAIASKYTDATTAGQYVDAFLKTAFDGGRHQRRVDKITQLERK